MDIVQKTRGDFLGHTAVNDKEKVSLTTQFNKFQHVVNGGLSVEILSKTPLQCLPMMNSVFKKEPTKMTLL